MNDFLLASLVATSAISDNPRHARTHSKKQLAQLERSITETGYLSPLLIDENNTLIAGHARLGVARQMGLKEIPVICLPGLSDALKRGLALADNKIPLNAGWDREKLAIEFRELGEVPDFDLTIAGFAVPEIDQILIDHEEDASDPIDDAPALQPDQVVSTAGDLWVLKKHRVLQGDARSAEDVRRAMNGELAAMCFTDPPYNVSIKSIVGRGERKHDEFAMASGEMTDVDFTEFLFDTLNNAAGVSRAGAVHFACMDWRHLDHLSAAAKRVYHQTLNLIVWVKSNAGQGSFYRSQHELIGVYRVGDDPHLNNIELGKHGRNRSNVWHYAGVNSFGQGRLDDLASHPTVKPVAMIADAIKDCTKRGDIVIDVFGGSGSTLMACDKVGRAARLLELEGRYVDVTVRRWQAFTGYDAILDETGETFDEVASRRAKDAA